MSMNSMNVDQVLMQMRVLAAQAKGMQNFAEADAAGKAVNFSELLVRSIDAVNDAQKISGDLKTRFDTGDQSVNIVDVVVASEKANIAFAAMTEVRGKLVKAYQEVMSMQI